MTQESLVAWIEGEARRLRKKAKEGAMPGLARRMMTLDAKHLESVADVLRDPEDERGVDWLRRLSFLGISLEKRIQRRIEDYGDDR